MQNYTLIPSLSEVLLEQSWVLGIEARPGTLTFTLDMVLTDKHSRYHSPRPGDQFCYLTGTVKFVGATALTWLNQGGQGAAQLKWMLKVATADRPIPDVRDKGR
ncbi:MAG: hypothetical protein M3N46_03410 [Actinomycetota bacterium]|nr:hypothetical protein [Actinomycetota bacterium]